MAMYDVRVEWVYCNYYDVEAHSEEEAEIIAKEMMMNDCSGNDMCDELNAYVVEEIEGEVCDE